MSQKLAALIDHKVTDFDGWKPHFSAHSSARKSASIVAEHVNRGADEPNRVIIFLAYEDPQRAAAFFDSTDLRQKMQAAGVTSPPEITFMKPQSERVVWSRPLPAIIVRHRVADYDAWRAVYDSVEELRRNNGIVGDAVNRGGDDSNDVVVYHQAETREALGKFLALPELKSAMARGGVLEAPEVTFVTGGV